MNISDEINLGDFTLDTLQIYFPWDDDLYTELKRRGFGKGEFKVLPLIYSDNTEVTIGQASKRRKFVIRPELFGRSYKDLGWLETSRRSEPIIPAEKPAANFSIVDLDEKPKIKVKVIPTVNNREQYHLEYSSMSAFGKMYSNWVALYLTPQNFLSMLDNAKQMVRIEGQPSSSIRVLVEPQQNQREGMLYAEVPVIFYKFCLASFRYAVEFFEHNGVRSEDIPCLVYDSSDENLKDIMSPLVKLGIVHTKEGTGFEPRKPQVVMKISQNKITVSQRGKRAKVKGKLVYEKENDSYLLMDAYHFILSSDRILAEFQMRSSQTPLF
jgi:hypothetical protein